MSHHHEDATVRRIQKQLWETQLALDSAIDRIEKLETELSVLGRLATSILNLPTAENSSATPVSNSKTQESLVVIAPNAPRLGNES